MMADIVVGLCVCVVGKMWSTNSRSRMVQSSFRLYYSVRSAKSIMSNERPT